MSVEKPVENLREQPKTSLGEVYKKMNETIAAELKEAKKIIDEGGDFSKIKRLTPELTKSLIKKNGEKGLDLSGLTVLDKETAAELVHFGGDRLKLSGLTRLDKETAGELAKCKGIILFLNGLKRLDKETATELAKWKGNSLFLNGLTRLDKETVAELAKYKGNSLDLSGLEGLDKDVAMELAKYEGSLDLSGLKSLNAEVAAELAKFKGNQLYLNGLTRLDADVASVFENYGGNDFNGKMLIVDHDVLLLINSLDGDYGLDDGLPGYLRDMTLSNGNIYLNGITEINLETAEALANYKSGYLSLDGLKTLTPDVARVLACFEGCLSLNGLEKITPEIATELSKHNGWIVLEGLSGIDVSTIEAFSNSECKLCLNGITTLDIKSEIALAKHKGEVSLGGLNSIKLPDLAKQLVDNTKGPLYLTGLKGIHSEIMAELVKFKGILYLPSLLEIDDETAEAICQNISESLVLGAQNSVFEKVAEVIERMNKGKELNQGLYTLEQRIQETGDDKDWKGERGKIEYDWKTNKIMSRGKETEVEKIEENSMRLVGLDLDLTLHEGMWLANLKNWVQYIDKDVTFERSVISKSPSFTKTLHIGGKVMLTRKTLNENISACETDEIVEKIVEWLNKR